jgi:hypothetical protein
MSKETYEVTTSILKLKLSEYEEAGVLENAEAEEVRQNVMAKIRQAITDIDSLIIG